MFGIVPKIQSRVCSLNCWSPRMLMLLNSEKGPFTIFFYCPIAKWAISLANINDIMTKPVEQVNTLQQIVIGMTGALMARWCWVLKPRQNMLVYCNTLMATTAVYQLGRKMYLEFSINLRFTGSLL